MGEGAVVGIDLGTTYSVCAIVENGRPRVISDTGGSYTIPSIVAIDDKGNRLIGQSAKRQSLINPVNTVYGSKRLVGRDINSPIIDRIQDHFKYRLGEGEHSDVLIKMRQENYQLEEIQAMILDHIRNTAQNMLGQQIAKAVITVPAYFNDRQRQAIREAGKVAELEVLRIINEPTAAALAYGFGKALHQKAAIFDLGGGTFDVSVLEIRDNVFEVKATGGDTFLGGVDFDNQLVEYVLKDFTTKNNIDLARDPMSHQRIKDACEQAKIDLSTLPETRIHIPFITMGPEGPLNIDITIKRTEFEDMIRPLIEHTMEITKKVISESGLKMEEIDALLLVGGSTRIPLVAKLVTDFMGKPPSKNVHPDEAVALGAAIMADALVNRESDIMLLDVLPINIGIGLPGGKVLPVFQRNTSVPNQKMKVFTTSKDNQDSLKIKLVQGDSDKENECEMISEFVFRGIHPAPKGQAKVEVVFTINAEGILSVNARDPDTGIKQTSELKVSSTLQKTFRKNLIQHQVVEPKKEAQKVITRTVTREKRISAPTPPPSAPRPPPTPSAQTKPAAQSSKSAATATPPPASAEKSGLPPKPVIRHEKKPGLLARLAGRLKRLPKKSKKKS